MAAIKTGDTGLLVKGSHVRHEMWSSPSVTDLANFFDWLRQETEAAWARHTPRDRLTPRVGGSDWQRGSRWVVLDESSIQRAEAALGAPFPPDYRLFVGRLHTLDRPMRRSTFIGDRLFISDAPSFTDWNEPDARLQEAEDWLVGGLAFDVENNGLWPNSWGARPSTAHERERRLRDLVRAAPTLIPILGHRFLVPHPPSAGNPVLSIYQSDAIIYASDLRSYLCQELRALLPSTTAASPHAESPLKLPFWDELVG